MSLVDNRQHDEAEKTLQQYGYRQEFRRELKRFASFAIGFSFISISTGIFTTYGSVLKWGGPRGIWTWPVIILALIWLVFELSIFRDASFASAWVYCIVMFALGLIYFAWMFFREPQVLNKTMTEERLSSE